MRQRKAHPPADGPAAISPALEHFSQETGDFSTGSSDEDGSTGRPIPSPVTVPTELARTGGDSMPGPVMLVAPTDETETLRQQLLQAQRLSSVGALASSVAHEFNNILTTIINYAKLGLKGAADPGQKQAFEKILKGGQRAATIVSGMLGFARNSSNRREDVDLVRLVEEVLLLTEKDLSKHRIPVEKRYHARPVVPVIAGQIEQILINLVINARQSMPNGGRVRADVREN